MASSSERADVLDVRKGLIAGEERVRQYGQRPVTVWLTGLPRAGKAETARVLELRLFDLGAFCVVLDSGSVRLGVSRDLDYTAEERTEHLRRVAEMARLLNNAGQMVICAFVSPLDHTRKQVREIIGEDRFCEVYVNTPLAVCEARDPKGVYKRAHDGELTNVPGINAVYEAPVDPDLKVSLENHDAEDAAGVIQELLRVRGIFPARDDQEA
jgi:adenylyl-sulfate kinase